MEGTDNYNYPDAIDGYNHADEWRGAMWLSAEDQNAVAFIGNKALGHNYYGYTGESMRHDWVIADVPPPDYYETDPDGKGWRAYNRQPMILFFDPDDLAKVAERIPPAPRAPALRSAASGQGLSSSRTTTIINSAAFDRENGLLYIVEDFWYPDGILVIHAWKVSPVSGTVGTGGPLPVEFQLYQNHPNPFNPETVIPLSGPSNFSHRDQNIQPSGTGNKNTS